MDRIALSPELSISRIVYGLWRLADDADRTPDHVRAKIDACLAQGITTFDEADIYGDYESEETFGGALKADPSLREKIEIATKCGIKLITGKAPDRRVKHYDTSPEHIAASVDASRKAMATDVIDLLMIHRPDPFMDHTATGRALDDLVDAGKVRAIGVSNFGPHDFTALQAAMRAPLVTNQIEASVLHLEPFVNGDIAFLQERGLAPMAWSPLGGGRLFSGGNERLHDRLAELGNGDASAAALAFLLAHPARIVPVVGTNNLRRIEALSGALALDIDRETWFEIFELGAGHEVP